MSIVAIEQVKKKSQRSTIEVNLIATTEEQFRLRDMGGIIVVDFIDMNSAENRKKLFNHLKNRNEQMGQNIKFCHQSKNGLIQITRQRVRPEMNIKTKRSKSRL